MATLESSLLLLFTSHHPTEYKTSASKAFYTHFCAVCKTTWITWLKLFSSKWHKMELTFGLEGKLFLMVKLQGATKVLGPRSPSPSYPEAVKLFTFKFKGPPFFRLPCITENQQPCLQGSRRPNGTLTGFLRCIAFIASSYLEICRFKITVLLSFRWISTWGWIHISLQCSCSYWESFWVHLDLLGCTP